jgi:hypothetical protein
MQFQYLILILSLGLTFQALPMKTTLQKYNIFQRLSPLTQAYNRVVPSFTKNASSSFKKMANAKSQLQKKSNEFVKPFFGAWQTASLPLLSDTEKVDLLFTALEEKSAQGKSTVYSNVTVEQLIEKIAKQGFIDEENSQGLKPLHIILNSNKHMSVKSQEKLLCLLEQSGANLHDQKALNIALKSRNVPALKILRPHFETNELSDYIQEIKDVIQQRQGELNQSPTSIFGSFKKAEIAAGKKALTVLEQKPKKITVKVQQTTPEGKESELTFEETYEDYLPRMFNAALERIKATFKK